MTSHLYSASSLKFLLAEAILKAGKKPVISVVAAGTEEFVMLQHTAASFFPPQSFVFEYHRDYSSVPYGCDEDNRIVISRITLEGFFAFLTVAIQTGLPVIALVDDIPEETVTARLVKVPYVRMSELYYPPALKVLAGEKLAV